MASEDPSDSKSRLSEMIEAEDAALDRVTEFIREGMRACRIWTRAASCSSTRRKSITTSPCRGCAKTRDLVGKMTPGRGT